MEKIMLILGGFPFMIHTAAYERFQRSFEYKWAEQERLPHPRFKTLGIGGPALQYMGPGTQTVSLNGAIYPGQQGRIVSLVVLRAMAGSGRPFILMSAPGAIMGRWVIKQVEETNTEYVRFKNGVQPRKIEFSMSLQRYVDYGKDPMLMMVGGSLL